MCWQEFTCHHPEFIKDDGSMMCCDFLRHGSGKLLEAGFISPIPCALNLGHIPSFSLPSRTHKTQKKKKRDSERVTQDFHEGSKRTRHRLSHPEGTSDSCVGPTNNGYVQSFGEPETEVTPQKSTEWQNKILELYSSGTVTCGY